MFLNLAKQTNKILTLQLSIYILNILATLKRHQRKGNYKYQYIILEIF